MTRNQATLAAVALSMAACATTPPGPAAQAAASCAERRWPAREQLAAEDDAVRVVVRARAERVDGDWAMKVFVELASRDGQAHDVALRANRGTTGTMTRPGYEGASCEPGSMPGQSSDDDLVHRVRVPAEGVARYAYPVRSVGMRCPGGVLTTALEVVRDEAAARRALPAATVDLLLTEDVPELALHPSDHINPGCTPSVSDCCG